MSCLAQWDTVSYHHHSVGLGFSNTTPYITVWVLVSLSSFLKFLRASHNWCATWSGHRSIQFQNLNLPSFSCVCVYLYSQNSITSISIYGLWPLQCIWNVFPRNNIDELFLPDMVSQLTFTSPEMDKESTLMDKTLKATVTLSML